MSYIEELNYWNDPRNQDAPSIPEGFPLKWEICPVCEGDGTVVNPAIDCGGLTAEDFAEDPDFAAEYMSGTYDQPCRYCRGTGKVQTVDRDRCDPDQLAEYDAELEADAQYAAECRAERMMGA